MSRRRWDDTRQAFTRIVFREGVDEVAKRTHVHRATIYRIINGKTKRPSGAVRAAVENTVADATENPRKVGE